MSDLITAADFLVANVPALVLHFCCVPGVLDNLSDWMFVGVVGICGPLRSYMLRLGVVGSVLPRQ